MNEVVWVVDKKTNSKDGKGGMYPTPGVPITEPSPTLTGKAGGQWEVRPPWTSERPATTVCADPRISEPGYRGRPEDYSEDGTYSGKRSMEASVKVTVAEASVLQSFPPDYPWQGSRTKQFEQVGNAIPPLLAAHILAALGVGELRSEQAA